MACHHRRSSHHRRCCWMARRSPLGLLRPSRRPAWRWPPPGLRQLQPPAAGPPGWRSALHLVEGGALLALRRLRRLLGLGGAVGGVGRRVLLGLERSLLGVQRVCACAGWRRRCRGHPRGRVVDLLGRQGLLVVGEERVGGGRGTVGDVGVDRGRSQRHLVAGHLRLVGVDLRLCASDLSSESLLLGEGGVVLLAGCRDLLARRLDLRFDL